MDNVKVAAEQAYATIVTELAAPRFFEKLAANGIAPRSEGEAAEMWSAASKLHVLYTAEQEKAAAAQVSSLSAANQQLDEVLAAAGLGGHVEKSSAYAGAANVAASQPEIAQAVLTLQAAAAAAMQNA
ncbi:hypothetical protein [Sphingorhabdus sp.]|uniref:hypothetical protein n=1 Tax=Sphingorhabdus sp. TaxID=1902408 RepID=UPI0033405F7B